MLSLIVVLNPNIMHVKYFTDTDTAYLQFNQCDIVETREVNEHVYLDLDGDGNLVGMTIEHAKERTDLGEVSFEEIAA